MAFLLPFLDLYISNGQHKECCVAMASFYSKFYPRMAHKRDAIRCGQLVGCCWRRWQVAVVWLVGWLAGFLPQGVHTKMLISWQARVLEMKCRFRGAGGVGGVRSPPQQHTRPQ